MHAQCNCMIDHSTYASDCIYTCNHAHSANNRIVPCLKWLPSLNLLCGRMLMAKTLFLPDCLN